MKRKPRGRTTHQPLPLNAPPVAEPQPPRCDIGAYFWRHRAWFAAEKARLAAAGQRPPL